MTTITITRTPDTTAAATTVETGMSVLVTSKKQRLNYFHTKRD